MYVTQQTQFNLVRIGGLAGLTGCLMYAIRSFPIPPGIQQPLFIFFGPILVVAYVGIFPLMAHPRVTIPAILGSVFGIIAASVNMVFAVVQVNNLFYIRRYASLASTNTLREQWHNILNGVFTVQNGMNYVADFFFDWTIFLWAALMWHHPKFGKLFTIGGIIAGGLHFGMKLITFPEPPAEAGLFDAGPLIGIWYAAVSIQAFRAASWVAGSAEARAQLA